MAKIPFLLRGTKTVRNLRKYMEKEFSEVLHTTLNPDGPGVIRIHLIPPKEEEDAGRRTVTTAGRSERRISGAFWTAPPRIPVISFPCIP